MSHLYFNDESVYSEKTTCDNEVFRSNFLHHSKKQNVFTLWWGWNMITLAQFQESKMSPGLF